MKKLLLILMLFFGVVSGTTRYVNTASSGGDGTTNSTSGSTAAYKSLSDAVTSYNGATITDDWFIYCTGTSDTQAITINNSASTHTLNIIGSDNFAGKKDLTKYHLISSSHNLINTTGGHNVKLEHLQMVTFGNYSAYYNSTVSGSLYINRCLIECNYSGSGVGAIMLDGELTTHRICNNIIYNKNANTGLDAVYLYESNSADCRLYHNTIVNFYRGVYRRTGNVMIVNNAFVGNTTDTTGGGFTNYGSVFNASPTFVDVTNFDYHLNVSDEVLNDNANYSNTDTLLCSFDIDSLHRGAQPWAVGADEVTINEGGHYSVSINYIKPANVGLAGDTVDLIGEFGTSNTVNMGTIISQTIKHIKMVVPSSTTAKLDSIVITTNSGDSGFVAFNYLAPKSYTTRYVDKTLAAATTTYNPVTRLSTGGTDYGYPRVNSACTAMVAGDHILLRGGTYKEGHIRLPDTKNGSAWVDGYYNYIGSYPGEWAIIDAEKNLPIDDVNSQCAIGCVVAGGGFLEYWKLERLEIVNGVTSTGSTAAGFWGNKGPFWIKNCIFRDNMASVDNGNPAGISGQHWQKSIVEYCYFLNNGCAQQTISNSHINIYSDYDYARVHDSGFVYDDDHTWGNVFRYNYFDGNDTTLTMSGIRYKAEQLFSGRNVLTGHTYNDYYYKFGDRIHNNIFRRLHGSAIYGLQDFTIINNNIIDSCLDLQIGEGDGISLYKNIIYNNTMLNRNFGYGILANHHIYYPNADPRYFIKCYNNIIDGANDHWLNCDLSFWYPEDFTGATLDSVYNDRQLFYKPYITADDPDGTHIIMFGLNTDKYTKSEYNAIRPNDRVWLSNTDGLYRSTYIPNGSFVLNSDTTIQNGGIGGDYPSYIGAVDPSDTAWVPAVLSLSSLGTEEEPVANPPVITSQPRDSTVVDGSTVSFSITATNATDYQWYGNGELIPGATSTSYAFTATLAHNNSKIYCRVTNTTDTVWSDTAVLTVNALPKTPANITVEPVSDTVTAGQSVMFFVTATGSDLTYQWYRNDSLIAGATNDTFTYTSRSQVGNYTDNIYCLLTTDTTISTDTVQLLVNGIVFRQSTDTLKLVCANNVNVQSWQWYLNGSAISGATDSVLTITTDSTSANKRVYYCVITNGTDTKKVGDWAITKSGLNRSISRKNKY